MPLPRIVILFLRLLDIHINNIMVSLGDQSFPKRIEVMVKDIAFSGSVQHTQTTTVSLNLSIMSITVNNRENAFDNQPNMSMYNSNICINGILSRRLILQQITVNLGKYIHIQLDKSLYRQYTAIMKAMYRMIVLTYS